jgi:hypothetical protein
MTTPHESRLAELAQRAAEIDVEVAALDDAYASVAGQFETGNAAALKQAEQIEHKVSALKREKALAQAAQARIEQSQKQELIEAEQQAIRQRLVEARKHADAAMILNTRIDEALRALADLFGQRSNALHALANTGAVNSVTINKLTNKSAATRAACAARLHAFISLETCAPGSMQPLSVANNVLQIGRAAAAIPDDAPNEEHDGTDAIPRRRLFRATNNGGDRS